MQTRAPLRPTDPLALPLPFASSGGERYRNSGNTSLLAHVPPWAVRVLDVGCGPGDNARILRDRGHRVCGLTISGEEAALARAHCEEVWQGDVETMDLPTPSEPFHALLMSHVLEHLVAPQRALTRLASLLAPGGMLCAAIPNMANWVVRWRIVRGDWSREDTGYFDRTHIHFWGYRTGTDVLVSTPFELVDVFAADPGIPARPLRRVLPRAAGWLDRAAGRLLPNLTASQVIILARLGT